MKRVWIYERKGRPGHYVGWYDLAGQRRSKHCGPLKVAQRFAERKLRQLNEDLFPDAVRTRWVDLEREYLQHKRTVELRAPDTLRMAEDAFRLFREICGPIATTDLCQRHIDRYKAERLRQVKPVTVNRELRTLRGIVNWAIEYRMMDQTQQRIRWLMLKTDRRPPTKLTATQRRNLCIAAHNHSDAWYMRVLLSMTLGLRKNDIERLAVSDFDFEESTVKTRSQKTGKRMDHRPVHPKVLAQLARHIEALPPGQDHLFTDTHTHKRWKCIRLEAGLPDLRYHDLRAVFGSFVAETGIVGEQTVQELMEHTDPRVTRQIYVNVSDKYRIAVDSLNVDDLVGL